MEELELHLDVTEASALFLLLETAIDTLKFKAQVLGDIGKLKINERPKDLQNPDDLAEVIRLNSKLRQDGLDIMKEVGQIILELGLPKGPIIIPKPKFSAKD